MSAKLLNNVHHKLRGKTRREADAAPAKAREYKWSMLLLLPLWVTAAYTVSNFIVALFILALSLFHMSLDDVLRPAVLQTSIATVIYIMTIAIVIGIPHIWRRTTSLKILGLQRLPSWTDIGLAPVTYIVYAVTIYVILQAITSWIPGFPIGQAQDVGFDAYGSRFDNMLAFVTLVIMAPIAEETLFRGYLYGKLKNSVPAIVAAVATSLLFALAHGQWNVGVDVFVLSLILCGLRSLTGSIWAGVLVHMIKNGIAYYVLFVSPFMGG